MIAERRNNAMARKEIRRINGKEYQHVGSSLYREQAEEIAREWLDQGFVTKILKHRIDETTVYDVYVCF